jgi:hypothetical protein
MIITIGILDEELSKNKLIFDFNSNKKLKTNLENIVYLDTNMTLLKTIVLYGKNQIGKSKILEDIYIIKEQFNFDKVMIDKKLSFFIKFTDNIIDIYEYEIEFNNKKVVKEILKINDKLIYLIDKSIITNLNINNISKDILNRYNSLFKEEYKNIFIKDNYNNSNIFIKSFFSCLISKEIADKILNVIDNISIYLDDNKINKYEKINHINSEINNSKDDNKLILIDNIENGININDIYKSFNNNNINGNNTQLLLTAYNPLLYKEDILREDQIYFLTKNKSQNIYLVNLLQYKNKLKIRFTKTKNFTYYFLNNYF